MRRARDYMEMRGNKVSQVRACGRHVMCGAAGESWRIRLWRV